ncbi:hypothetical protein DFH07DRAFT_950395 [Mycena maculata]|uniref:DUF6534 domain-containing protein n=1 Tax=Mycena maculata TaxID=230809 RepID=A0AAD7K6G9_9AGAR|nr:hypothetical protein DFH07DRAFT_950395 [Mycena maculata]
MDSIAWEFGPILFGGSVALMLSGIVAVQCIIFFKLYPDEARIKTAMVAGVWALDLAQSSFILSSLFHFFIVHFGDATALGYIPWSIALTILLTAMQTCVVHLFYVHKIYRSSGTCWWITIPIAFFACLRLLAAILATAYMFHFGAWEPFLEAPYPRARLSPFTSFLFTAGLSLSAGTDAIITACLCYYLRKIRKLSSSSVMKCVFDTLTLYTLENGLLTCLTTVAALVFWLVLPRTMLALSLHFVIGKLYPNSLLVLLNTRKELREMHSGDQGIHFGPSDHLANYYTDFPHRAPLTTTSREPLLTLAPVYGYRPTFKMHHPPVEIKVQRTVVQRGSAEISEASFDLRRPYRPPRSLREDSFFRWPALP